MGPMGPKGPMGPMGPQGPEGPEGPHEAQGAGPRARGPGPGLLPAQILGPGPGPGPSRPAGRINKSAGRIIAHLRVHPVTPIIFFTKEMLTQD